MDSDKLESLREEIDRLRELLKEVASCGVEHTVEGRYHVMQVSTSLLSDIEEEVSQ